MKNFNSRNTQGVLMLSKWLQCGTGRSYLLLHHHHKKHSSRPNRTLRDHSRHNLLQEPILLHHIQDIRIHYPSDCWLISCFFSAAHLLNTSLLMYNQRSNSSRVNRKAKPRLGRHHRGLSLLPPWRPRHLLPLLLVLPRQVQQVCSYGPFHYGLVSFFVFAVYPDRHSHCSIWPLVSTLHLVLFRYLFVHVVCGMYFSSQPPRF
ncbi:hypothetical protein BD769DRAFT_1527569 [Suillus cothurnatus]|nr:hypothetical protein BD769DRAFT_1527569 [Suillus cothurnatus]